MFQLKGIGMQQNQSYSRLGRFLVSNMFKIPCIFDFSGLHVFFRFPGKPIKRRHVRYKEIGVIIDIIVHPRSYSRY
jgi:hypothetical protein